MSLVDFEFVDELEANSYPIESASRWDFENYYVFGDKVLYINGDKYRVLIKHPHYKQWKVYMRDTDGICRTISKRQLQKVLKEQYDLIFFEE